MYINNGIIICLPDIFRINNFIKVVIGVYVRTLFIATGQIKITGIMKNEKSTLITNLFVFIAGILLIILHNRVDIMEYIVVILGLMFLFPSVVSLIVVIFQRRQGRNTGYSYAGIIPAIGGIIFGMFLVVRPDIFVGIMVYMLAAILILGGLYQILFLAMGSQYVRMPLWLYIFPVLMVIAGVVIIFTDLHTLENMVVLITGIALVCFSVNSLLEYMGNKSVYKSVTK